MIEPFGTDTGEANPFALQTPIFLGLTVVDFSCNSSWDSQGGQCNIRLIQDEGQYLENALVGSPQYFELISVDNAPVFRFYGILMDMSREVNTSSKTYTVTLQSPTLLLEAPSLILDTFAGFGGALEASGPNVPTCLDFGSKNSTINITKVYNILNLFGAFENDTNGLPGAGFGRSVVNQQGMRVDAFAYALDEILNGNPYITPSLGSNIIYGADSYINSNAYAYNFDIYGFLNQVASFLPNDYRVQATTIMDFVTEVCQQSNHIFYVDLLKPEAAGSIFFSEGHTSTRVPLLTHANTIYGGQIVVITQNRNNSATTKFPLSAYVVGREASDKLGGLGQIDDLPLDIGMTGTAHPDGPPVASSPYGGSVPVENISPDELERFIQTSLKVRLNSGAISAKYVVGGYQSRINYVNSYGINRNKAPEIYGSTCYSSPPADSDTSPDVYWYWGDINISARTGVECKNVPVITTIIDDPRKALLDIVAIDLFEFIGDLTVQNLVMNGVYLASIQEIQNAVQSYEDWTEFLSINKPQKIFAIQNNFTRTTIIKTPIFREDPNLMRQSIENDGVTSYSNTETSSRNTKLFDTLTDFLTDFEEVNSFANMVWEAVKSIGETHYGKSFAAKGPAFTIKQDVNDESPLGSYIKSWDIAQDGYLDPLSYPVYEAPDGNFVKGGRVSAYANYYSITPPWHDVETAEPISYDLDPTLGTTTTTYSDPDYAQFNSHLPISFKNFSNDEKVVKPTNNSLSLVSVPLDVSEEYILIPTTYFTFYNYIIAINSPNVLVNYLTSLIIPQNGINCTPYVKCSTKGVFCLVSDIGLSIAAEAEQGPPNDPSGFIAVNGPRLSAKALNSKDREMKTLKWAITPKSFGIPQQSNRYVYGPWATESTTPYGSKVEYVREDSLVPENYILPSDVSFGGVPVTITSGYDGMNTVGRLMANTVENFDFLFTEEGSLSMAGYPRVTNLGQALIDGGPLVSDISVNISATEVVTSYNMTTFAPKFGRAGKYLIDKLTRLARRIENGK